MNRNDDFIGQLEEYLEDFDGETPLPDRVRDVLHAELPRTRQVHPRLGLMKGTSMSSNIPTVAKWGLVAAALVAVGFGAAIALPGAPQPIPTPSPTPSSVPSPTASPQAFEAAPQVPCADPPTALLCLPAGTYRLGETAPGGLIDVPSGWWPWNPGAGATGLIVEVFDAADGSGFGILFTRVGGVSIDPCDQSEGKHATPDVDTPAELAAVMAAWPGFAATPAEPITIGGVDGVQFQMTSSHSIGTCPYPTIWETPALSRIDGYPMLVDEGGTAGVVHPADFRIIDLDGQLLVIRAMASTRTTPFERNQGIADDPTRHEADLVALQAIVDSIRFEDAGP